MREYFLEDVLHPNGGITIKCKDDRDCEDDHDPWDRPCKYFQEDSNPSTGEYILCYTISGNKRKSLIQFHVTPFKA